MTTPLSHGATTVTLPGGLDWTDEFTWSPVEQTATPSVTGALIVQIGSRVSGRPITLDGRDSRAWIKRAQCDQLNAWAALPGAEFSLFVRGQARTVLFLEFTADPILRLEDGEIDGQTVYVPLFKFLEV